MRITLAFQRSLLWLAACALPAFAHTEWLATWNSELWHIHSEGAAWKDSWQFVSGSIVDVLATRHDHPEESSYLIDSPWMCLLIMAIINATIALLGLLASPLWRSLWLNPVRDAILTHTTAPVVYALRQQLYLVAVGLLTATPVAIVSLGSEMLSVCQRSWKDPFGRFALFYLAKFLIASSIFGCALTLIVSNPLSLWGSVLAYLFMLRWIIRDQQQRCPICLKRLGSPLHIGHPSSSLLDWNLHEYVCSNGHGVMHVPATSLACQSQQAWLPLI